MCFQSYHTLFALALITIALVFWTVAVHAALIDPSAAFPGANLATPSSLPNRIALRLESFMATVWFSVLGLLSLSGAAACLSFGPRTDQGHGTAQHCKMV
jgi:hypothetical protein